jgi:outer membrane protein assembly factor BamB
LLVAGSKQGTIYVLDRANLGGFNSSDQIVQSVTSGVFPQYTGLTYWNGRVYAAGNGPLQMFNILMSTGLLTFAQQTSHRFSFYENPVVSSKMAGSGIVWLVERFFTSSSTSIGILHAYDALNLHELYNSSQVASRDAPNVMLRFQPPVVVNGKVYVAGRNLSGSQGRVVVYGLLP